MPTTIPPPKKKLEVKKKLKELSNHHSQKISSIKEFLIIVASYGLVINYSIHFIFGTRFTIFSFLAWGILYYFIQDEFVEWFRRLIAKR